MKKLFLTILQWKLTFLAKRVLLRYAPKIVAVGGSVGKTSGVQAIAIALQTEYNIGQTLRSYNQELGVPLSILRQETGYRSLWRWLSILYTGAKLVWGKVDPTYPNLLVLELGADKVGDMDRLLAWIHPDIAVVTAATIEHVEFFGSIQAAVVEEQKLAMLAPRTSTVILNSDDLELSRIATKIQGQVIRYAVSGNAEVVVGHARIMGTNASDVQGIAAKVLVDGSAIPVVITDTLGTHSFYAIGAAFAVAKSLQLNLAKVSENLRAYQPPAGRMRLIRGIKQTLIIDDTYNSSPAAARAAVDTLHQLSTPGQKFAVLGDMRELGSVSEAEHASLGQYVVGKADILITVGESARDIARGAQAAGMDTDKVFSFGKAEEAGRFIQDRMHTGDLLLIKASQGTRCEKIVKEIMAEPLRAKELLTRQYKPWVE
ncbi:MAG: UDP-N-acetylmuramoyl-tripeptide--D-alanyl-D-alanine ligase [Patescibacteria group bacterium]|jgi:UDP-N-acetylmuramoyl-tripeptide--D-alanyl-D-alanine ligase